MEDGQYHFVNNNLNAQQNPASGGKTPKRDSPPK